MVYLEVRRLTKDRQTMSAIAQAQNVVYQQEPIQQDMQQQQQQYMEQQQYMPQQYMPQQEQAWMPDQQQQMQQMQDPQQQAMQQDMQQMQQPMQQAMQQAMQQPPQYVDQYGQAVVMQDYNQYQGDMGVGAYGAQEDPNAMAYPPTVGQLGPGDYQSRGVDTQQQPIYGMAPGQVAPSPLTIDVSAAATTEGPYGQVVMYPPVVYPIVPPAEAIIKESPQQQMVQSRGIAGDDRSAMSRGSVARSTMASQMPPTSNKGKQQQPKKKRGCC